MKRACLENDISSDSCCVCFQAFVEDVEQGTGAEWVQCMCTHWLHKDCILDSIIDSSGKEGCALLHNVANNVAS